MTTNRQKRLDRTRIRNTNRRRNAAQALLPGLEAAFQAYERACNAPSADLTAKYRARANALGRIASIYMIKPLRSVTTLDLIWAADAFSRWRRAQGR